MQINTKYYQEMLEEFKERYPNWAADMIRCQPKHSHAIRVTLKNGDQVDYNIRTHSSRYRNTNQVFEASPDDITDDDCRADFSMNLCEQMKMKGFGQADLAHRTGLSTAIISKYLTRNATPTITSLRKIAHALECHPDELLE